ncbi:M6 family metalloprotease domain-containing protein [Streptomyces physcomitrii]|uniref:M6 family metalloprotease domain-containing protein n=1 Tax=Streptomyces physcomitrii TaxID=2724184 RepID=UPI00099BFB83
MTRIPHPEVDVPRPLPVRRLTRGEWPRLRSAAAAATSLSALAATSLVAGPAVAATGAGLCQLTRTAAHHSEGVDTWNSAYPRPRRTLDAVMVFLSFPDSGRLHSTRALAADHFPATSTFFARASYGQFRLRAHPQHRWIRMPKPSTDYEVRRDWNPEKRGAYLRDALKASDPRVDFSRYDVVYFVADPEAPGVDSDATKVVNFARPLRADGTDLRRVVTVFERHPPDRNVLAHETGHVFDLPDLYHRPADGKGDWDTYVGDWDLMGSQFGLAPDFFAWHKWRFGWLKDDQVACVHGTQRLALEPVSRAPAPEQPRWRPRPQPLVGRDSPATTAGPAPAEGAPAGLLPGRSGPPVRKLAVVRTGRESALAVEARSRTGNDHTTCTEGVLLYRVRVRTASGEGPVEVVDTHPRTEACWGESVYPPLADAPLRVGESFKVPGEPVRISVEGRTGAGDWKVRIQPG